MTSSATLRSGYDDRRRRRRFLCAALSLTLGVMATVAVAWACAVGSSVWTVMAPIDPPPDRSGAYGLGPPPWYSSSYRGFGVTGTIALGPRDHMHAFVPPVHTTTRVAFFDEHMTYGWPMRAMSYHLVKTDRPYALAIFPFSTKLWANDEGQLWLVGGLARYRDNRNWYSGMGGGRHIPLTPRPSGFIINTLLVAIPLYFLLGGWTEIRAALRLRKGRCPRCGYDSRGLPACPECGLESPSAPSRAQHSSICSLPFALCSLATRRGCP